MASPISNQAPRTVPLPQPKKNDDVLMVGFNKNAQLEADGLRARGNNVTFIGDSKAGQGKITAGGAQHDLNSDAGVDKYVGTLGLPADQTRRVGDVLKGIEPKARDEMGSLAGVWANGEKGGTVPSRLVMSGHSAGSSMWGDDNGSIRYDQLKDLAKAMPKAAAQVEDLHLAACYAGTQQNVDRLREAFPKMNTMWGYHGSAPGSESGALAHQRRWDAATRGRADTLDRDIAANTRKGENVSTWDDKNGLRNGQPPVPLDTLRQRVTGNEATFQQHFSGEQVQASPATGPLRDYYNQLQGLIRHPNLTAAERAPLEERRDQTIRMIYYGQNVAPKFNTEHSAALNRGYEAAGLGPAPNFGTMSRADALRSIRDLDAKVNAGSPAAAREAQRLLHGLRDLSSSVVPDGWI